MGMKRNKQWLAASIEIVSQQQQSVSSSGTIHLQLYSYQDTSWSLDALQVAARYNEHVALYYPKYRVLRELQSSPARIIGPDQIFSITSDLLERLCSDYFRNRTLTLIDIIHPGDLLGAGFTQEETVSIISYLYVHLQQYMDMAYTKPRRIEYNVFNGIGTINSPEDGLSHR